MFVKVFGHPQTPVKMLVWIYELELDESPEMQRKKNVYFFISNLSHKDGVKNTFYN